MKYKAIFLFFLIIPLSAMAQNQFLKLANNNCYVPDITEEQKAEILELKKKYGEDIKALTIQADNLKKEYYKELRAELPNRDKLKCIARDLGEIHEKMEYREAVLHLDILSVLNEKQKEWYRRNRLIDKKRVFDPKPIPKVNKK